MSKTCEKCIHHDVCRYPLEWRAFPDTCWKYEEHRPKGEWICEGAMADYTNKLVYMCSICGCHFSEFEEDINVYNFCPNCGADMRNEGEGE